MEVEIFTLCDAATEGGGKLNILGTFDRIQTRQFPAAHPHCAIAVRIRFERIEEGNHRVRITFVNADGQPLLPGLDGNLGVRMPPEVDSVCANMILNFNDLKFQQAGQYSIDLAIDGRHERSLPVTVILLPAEPPPAPGGN